MIDLNIQLFGNAYIKHNLDEALDTCRQILQDGVEHVIVVDRMPLESSGDSEQSIKFHGRLGELRERLYESGSVELLTGSGFEWPFGPDLCKRLSDFAFNPSINEGRHLLVRLPSVSALNGYEKVFNELIGSGYVPIIVRPECSRFIRRQPTVIEHLINMGCMIQVDYRSVIGAYTREVSRFTSEMLENRRVHFFSTRASLQNLNDKGLTEAVERAGKIMGRSAALALVKDNPLSVLSGTSKNDTPLKNRTLLRFETAVNTGA